MGNIAERKKLPDLKDLNRIWFEIQKEMTESGKIVRLPSSRGYYQRTKGK